MDLIAPPEYLAADPMERALVCNGCGPGSWRLDPIPDRIGFGLDLTPACMIHDWMYAWDRDRLRADVYFLANMTILACQCSVWLLPMRLALIACYFLAVRICGGPYFGSSLSAGSGGEIVGARESSAMAVAKDRAWEEGMDDELEDYAGQTVRFWWDTADPSHVGWFAELIGADGSVVSDSRKANFPADIEDYDQDESEEVREELEQGFPGASIVAVGE